MPATPSSSVGLLTSASSRAPVNKYPIMGRPGHWQRATVSGRVRAPRLQSDEAKLRELFVQCRAANFREVRALVAHFPWLLTLTDVHGFGALHHAEMSGNPDFVAEVLQLYRDPRTFALKLLTYETVEELLLDIGKGFFVGLASDDKPGFAEETAVARCVGEDTLAAMAGILPGDHLEAISGRSFLSSRQPPPVCEDVLGALCAGFAFPATLEFRGSACQEMLVRDGWSPCHAAAGTPGRPFRKILDHLLKEQGQAPVAQDIGGCQPRDWSTIKQRSAAHVERRPLSATPRGAALARSLQQGLLPPRPSTSTDEDPAPRLQRSHDLERKRLELEGVCSGPAQSRGILQVGLFGLDDARSLVIG